MSSCLIFDLSDVFLGLITLNREAFDETPESLLPPFCALFRPLFYFKIENQMLDKASIRRPFSCHVIGTICS